MKKKVVTALLLAGAVAVAPVGELISAAATASSNNTVNQPSASSNNTVSEPSGSSSNSSSGSSSNSGYTADSQVEDRIVNAESGAVISIEGATTLSNSVMKELLKRGDVTLVMKYTYQNVDYVITIPAGAALDNDIPWYGPLYLAAHYGNGVSAPAGAGAATYTVKSGDTLSKIAKANGMTLAELAAKNPQIKNVNVIKVGQQINLK